MIQSKILAKLRAGQPALLTCVNSGSTPLIVEVAARAGFDGIWLDMEHRPISQLEIATLIMAARIGGADAYVRIRKGEGYTSVFRPLQDGAAGIMVPHVKTREEAEWVVCHAKYPPLGRRGTEIVMPDADASFAAPMDYIQHANRETFVAVQIEDREALDNLDDIVAVQGIDVYFIGPADLSLSLGVPFQFDHPKYREAEDRIARAVTKHGKWWGRPVRDAATAREYADRGARFLSVGGDFYFLKDGMLKAIRECNEALKGIGRKSRKSR